MKKRIKIKVLSIDKVDSSNEFVFYYYDDEKDCYHFASITQDDKLSDFKYPQKFTGYEHFAGVIGKFNPYVWFTRDPYVLKRDWGYEEVKECYNYFNQHFWDGTGSPWG